MSHLKKIIPEFIKRPYHKLRGILAAAKYGFPARGMIVVGITGTKGKTSTGNYIWSVLHWGGYKAGLISSANFRFDEREEPNPYHMTMPDPFLIQKKLREMRDLGISIVVMEMTSEGMKQFRHTGIPVDIAVFTNLTPEHLGSHKGDFEVYKKAKGALFAALNHEPKKLFEKAIPRTIIANADSKHSAYYLDFPADKKITYGIEQGIVRAVDHATGKDGTTFSVDGESLALSIPGVFNIYNALPALIVGQLLGIPNERIREGLLSLKVIPGRMELIDEGQGFLLVVDYAHETASLGALIETAKSLKAPSGRVILLTGVIGGGRESRVPLVRIAAKNADTLIITNEDPYDEDPSRLISELENAAKEEGKVPGKDLFAILDRREAIQKALRIGRFGDIVLISGKGAEQTMMTKEGAIPWNEREIVRSLARDAVKENQQNHPVSSTSHPS